MDNRCMAEAIQAIRKEFVVEIADTAQMIDEAFRLRFQVYCLERQFEESNTGRETDQYDAHSRHVVLRCRATREVLGTLRLVLPTGSGRSTLPIRHLCDPKLLQPIPHNTSAEVSRFALSKLRRDMSRTSALLLRVGLVQGAVRLSNQLGLTHWCAVMEPGLLRLMATTGIRFRPLGPLVEYHGLRQPSYCEIGPTLARMACERPDMWDYVTGGGRFWSDVPTRELLVA